MTRKEITAKYGTWFGDSTPDHIIKRCDEQIANYQKWILNLGQLKQEQLAKKAEEHKEELKAMLEAMGEEERTNFINSLKGRSDGN